MKLTCVINSMSGGGAERVMTHLSGGLARRGHKVTVTTLDPAIPDFYPAPPGVERTVAEAPPGGCRWYQLGRQRARVLGLRRRILEQAPDAVISFVDVSNILTLAACRGSGIPVVACERINPRQYRIGPHWELLRRLLYPSAACVVMLTEDTLSWARGTTGARAAAAIHNPVPTPRFSDGAPRPDFFGPGKNLLAMGRLEDQKGFDLLLRAFADIAAGFPDWRLTILGEGPERARLEALRDGLGLGGRAMLPGTRPNSFDVLKYADLFVFSSRFEGFGMALAEALA
ncbi:MAG: glycosyltransferase, partial [Elusimicrobiales bacterium]